MLMPIIESELIALQPASIDDAGIAYEIQFRLGSRRMPLIDNYIADFGIGKSAYFMIRAKDSDEVIGTCSVTDPTPAGTVRAEVDVVPECTEKMRRDVNVLITNFAFAMWPTRKVYWYVTESDPERLSLDRDLARQEAVLPKHRYFHGRQWDVYIYAVYRDDWTARGPELIASITTG